MFILERESEFGYADRILVAALVQQIVHGAFNKLSVSPPPIGTFDVVGKDRRNAWIGLGDDLGKEEAMRRLVNVVSKTIPDIYKRIAK